MFVEKITNTQLAAQVADSLFPYIDYSGRNIDESLVCTTRMLAHERLTSKRENLNVSIVDGCNGENNLDADNRARNSLYIQYRLVQDQLNSLKSDDSEHNGFRRILDVEMYLGRMCDCAVFYNDELHSTIVFLISMNKRIYHYVQSVFPRLVPWVFEGRPITAEEKKMLRSLSRHDGYDAYMESIKKFEEAIDIRRSITKAILGNMSESIFDYRKSNLENKIQSCNSEIQSLQDQIQGLLGSKFQMNLELNGLLMKCDDGSFDELVDYISNNKYLYPIDVYDGNLRIVCATYLENFDPDIYETYIDNENSFFYEYYDNVTDSDFNLPEGRKKILDGIFAGPLKVRMCAMYDIRMEGYVNSERGYGFDYRFDDYIRNPHLHYFNCFGDYKRFIDEAIEKGDYIFAVENCLASAKSLNIGEHATCSLFIKDLLETEKKVIELPDGKNVTVKEAYQWLLEVEHENKTEETQAEETVDETTETEE